MSGHNRESARLIDTIRATFESYVAAQSRDAKATLEHFHRSSPTYESAREMLHQLFLNYKLRCALETVDVVGMDESYVYARVRQRTEKVEGPAFRDNVTDVLIVLREDEGAWKIWNQALLSVEAAPAREAAGGE
ncbi:MAG: hypothetical protein C0P79_012900 [Gammaproteobacteria bacterium]|nr:hypothetical protein [Gammaproteobacteria bacterium]